MSKYNISKHRYRELYNFCMQYRERETKIAEYRNLTRQPPNGMPNGSGLSDPTASAGINAAILDKQNEIIRESAREAAGNLYKYLMLAVVDGYSFNSINARMRVPCYEREFIRMRHEFYYLLDKKRR